jgi:hypothetical protein
MRNERGIALAVALFALVVIGTLVATALFVVRLELRSADGVLRAGAAFSAAEGGVATTIATWPPAVSGLAEGDSVTLPDLVAGPGARVTGVVQRINEALFLVRADGEMRDSGGSALARRAVAELVRLDRLSVPLRAALLARGSVAVEGGVALFGDNADPPGWNDSSAARLPCAIDTTALPAVETGAEVVLDGAPVLTPSPLEHSSAAGDTALYLTPFDTLATLAGVTVGGGVMTPSPSVASGRCDRADPMNWGEPLAMVDACSSYVPVIHVTGDLTMDGGRGQGIVLVDGNAMVRGDAQFAGIIMARGTFSAEGAAQVFGTVLANDAALAGQRLGGAARLHLSMCAIRQALGSAARPRRLGAHAWVPIY